MDRLKMIVVLMVLGGFTHVIRLEKKKIDLLFLNHST